MEEMKKYIVPIESNSHIRKIKEKYNLLCLNRIGMKNKKEVNYNWHCNVCENDFEATISQINRKEGCIICHIKDLQLRKENRKIEKNIFEEARKKELKDKKEEINGMDFIKVKSKIKDSHYSYITVKEFSSDIADLLLDEQDKNISVKSNKICRFKCPDCDFIFTKSIRRAIEVGIKCPRCSVSMPFSEIIMSEVLNQLGINYIHDKSQIWSQKKRYDFFFKDIVIEMHGEQHYSEDGFKYFKKSRKKRKDFIEERENDIFKKELALKNGIKHYIIINCSYCTFSSIKDNILKSELSSLFDLSKIDWNKCTTINSGKIYQKVCQLYNENFNIKEITEILSLSSNTVYKLLEKSTLYKDTNYQKNLIYKKRPVYCITTDKKFNSATEAGKFYNTSATHIIACCKGKRKSAGKDKNEAIKLFWKYLDIKDETNEKK